MKKLGKGRWNFPLRFEGCEDACCEDRLELTPRTWWFDSPDEDDSHVLDELPPD